MGGKKNSTIFKPLNRSEEDKATFDIDWDSPECLFTLTLNAWLCLLLNGWASWQLCLKRRNYSQAKPYFAPLLCCRRAGIWLWSRCGMKRDSQEENWHLFTDAGHKIIQVCSLPLQYESSLVSYRHTKSQILSINWTVQLLLAENQKNKCWAQKVDFQSSSWSTCRGLFRIRHSSPRNFPSPSLQEETVYISLGSVWAR